ncbi:HAD family hydrolase [Actinocorallia populi]|uniref:HAD family hydrolase n=1 Tax=Actinocorallia populi TaxID=2079200 RepID=UPI000D089755|nr:HAD family hydrolase [Actinocorallia populi]
MIKAVLWDVDDTLSDYTSADMQGVIRHFTAEGLPCDEAAYLRWRTVTDAAYARFSGGELTFVGQRRERARAYLGAQATDEEADAWFARYLVHDEACWTVFPDVVPVFAALAHRHAVLSNSNAALQERRLTALGLRHHFEFLACSDQTGHAKPAPAAFRHACAALGLPPAEVAYVGDRLDLDALGAEAAGLHGIWLDRTGPPTTPPPGVHRITTLARLPALLSAL